MNKALENDLQLKFELAVEALRKADERDTAGRLALEIMHDIRNPLEALRNLNYLVSVAAGNAEEVHKYTGLAEEQLDIAIEIANSTLGFARATSQPRLINVAGLVDAAVRIHQRTIERKHIHLAKDLARDAVAPLHPGQMLQVVSNLVANALDAMPPGGTLSLRLKKHGNELRLMVADNGHGIPPSLLADIFQPFFTTKEERGTGLGLALAHKIVERHRGKIRVRSCAQPGKSGTLFLITMPT